MKAIELFGCSGGMAEGFRRAGVRFTWCFDWDADACASYTANLGHAPVRLDVRHLVDMVRAGWSPGPLDLLVADPPCTPWSRAGKRKGLADERDMLRETVELIRLLRPRAYLIGNVPGLEDAPSWKALQRVLRPLAEAGYCIRDFACLDAADYGWVDLCQRHAHFAGRLSAPTTVQGTAESTRRVGVRARTARAPDAGSGSGRTTGAGDAAPATPVASDPSTAASAGVGTTTGRAAESSTIEGMCGCAMAAGTGANIASSPSDNSAGNSARRKSSTTRTNGRTTTIPETSRSTPATASTCGSTSRVGSAPDAEVAGCPDCRWYATPQHRVRPFWFGHLAGPCITWPARTHGDPAELGTAPLPGVAPLRPWVTCREALAHLSHEDLGRPVRLRWRGDGSHPSSRADRPAKVVPASQPGNGGATLLVNDKHPISDPDAPSRVVRARGDAGAQGGKAMAWPWDRPSTTILADPRIPPPGHHDSSFLSPPAGTKRGQGQRVGNPEAPAATMTAKVSRVGAGEAHTLQWPWERPATTVCAGIDKIAPAGEHAGQFGPNAIVLSERAAAVLQGFPEGWVFAGKTKRARWAQIGMAMPPPLAHVVAAAVVAQMARAEERCA